MTVKRENRRRAGVKKILCLVLACSVMAGTGCGQEEESNRWNPEDVELLEPVGVSQAYEEVSRRDLYDAQTYYAQVCPYVEEYELDSSIIFDSYDALPGDPVKKGGAIFHADFEDADEQIKSVNESIAEMDEEYQEFLADNAESREKAQADQEACGKVLENFKNVPQQYLTDPATGEQTVNPAYTAWENNYNDPMWGYKAHENRYRQATQTLMELDEALKERTELYELDRRYKLLTLERLNEDRKRGTLVSGMDGYVAAISRGTEIYAMESDILYNGMMANSGVPLAAVCDPERLEIRSAYIAKNVYEGAEDVYAVSGGKRYEVEYTPLDSTEEYERIENEYGAVYSVFYPQGDTGDLKAGDYAVIVVKRKSHKNVLTIPNDALVKEGSEYYTYVIKDGENVRTKVEVGISDGLYTEILSGLEEGDKVPSQTAVTAGDETVKVTRGKLSTEISTMGRLIFPSSEWVSNPIEYGTCYFGERKVERQQVVKKGDVLAEIRVVPDQVEMNRTETRLRRERDRLQDLLNENDEEKNRDAIEAKQETIRELEELLADMKADAATTQIVAPRDGVVRDYYDYEDNELLQPGIQMFQIADQDVIFLEVENTDNQLAYGNTVTVNYKDKNRLPHTVEGQVVTAGYMSLSSRMNNGRSLIVVPKDIFAIMVETEERRGYYFAPDPSFRVTAQVRTMEDVLLVPRKAVTAEGNSCYVKVKLETGEIQYKSFLSGGADKENYWVLEGLTEGMELCLD